MVTMVPVQPKDYSSILDLVTVFSLKSPSPDMFEGSAANKVSTVVNYDSIGSRMMEYIERTSYNTFYPLTRNKHQIRWHLHSVKILCAFKKSKMLCEKIG